ncbi:hypothetical protein Plhal710r2_c047g0150451 [Plasmopara halstedii]
MDTPDCTDTPDCIDACISASALRSYSSVESCYVLSYYTAISTRP